MNRLILIAVLFTLPTAAAAELDFDTEIVPLLSKAGCNAAACHGGAAGQAGFRLSLFGGDPEFDHRSIVHEREGRRINFVRPMESLFLAKPTGQLEHGGDEVLDVNGQSTKTIAAWISAGARRSKLRELERLEVEPSGFRLDEIPAEVQLKVVAHFDDGLARDVTRLAVYVSQDESALQVDEQGRMKVLRPGRHSAVIRFGGHVKTASVMSPLGHRPVDPDALARRNWIDDHINQTLQVLRLEPTVQADDASFLRRVSLDLIGRLPTRAAVEQFLGDPEDGKRARVIRELLESAEFDAYWTHWLADQLRVRKPAMDEVAAHAFYSWIATQIADEVGWDQIASQLLLSAGDTHVPGPAAVHRFFATPREQAEYVSEVLMGVRLRCANCHNHPLDHWTQDDYHGLSAIFAGLQRGQVIHYADRGEVTHPRTGLPAMARIPGGRLLELAGDKRPALADWLRQKDNPYFAKSMVGRVWEALMKRGLVSPVDDLRATNPATHHQLLDQLASYFVECDYKFRPLIELICNSAAYGRSSTALPGSPADDRFYSVGLRRELSAEVLADAIADVTGIGFDFNRVDRSAPMQTSRMLAVVSDAGQPSGTMGESQRVINVVDRDQTYAVLQFLGQCLPEEGCSANSSGQRGIASRLHLMNGALLNEKIISPESHLQQLLRNRVSAEELVVDSYYRALSRPPTSAELKAWKRRIDDEDPKVRGARAEDFLWALLNCHEFTTNH